MDKFYAEVKRVWHKITQREFILVAIAVAAALRDEGVIPEGSQLYSYVGKGLAIAAVLGYGALRTHRKNKKDLLAAPK